MKKPAHAPALNHLEMLALALCLAHKAEAENLDSKLAQELHTHALAEFVKFEAGYIGLEPDFFGAHERARELSKGL